MKTQSSHVTTKKPKGFTSKIFKDFSTIELTIKIEDISEGKEHGLCATVKELGNSLIMADSIEEIFSLMPDVLDVSQNNNIGIFKKDIHSKQTKRRVLLSPSKHHTLLHQA